MKHFIKVAAAVFTVAQIAAALPALAQATPAPEAAAKAGGPKINFSEILHQFGRVKSSDVLRHDFIVTNTGSAVLELTDVKPSCGCTMAGTWDRQIQPGQTGKIPIQFSPANFNGTVTKSVTVTCNDPAQAVHTLQIQATIWRPIDVQPAYVYFMPIEGEETNDTRIVHITSNLEEPLILEPPQCSHPAFTLELKTVQPGKHFELHVKYSGPASNAMAQTSITVKTSSTNLPLITIAANAMPQPALAVTPMQITLPAAPQSSGYRHTQVIRNNSSTPLKLTDAAVNADGVKVDITETQPGKMFRLNVNFPPNFQSPIGDPLKLTVHTSNLKRPVITVPIMQAAAATPVLARPVSPVVGGSKP
jgi:hypothetical protein